jgi:hypothetical protein
MYLAHINFRPVDGAVLLDSAPAPSGVRVIAEDLDARLLGLIREQPERHRSVSASLRYDPELVLALDCIAGTDGLVHAMQVHPDGQADFVTHRSADFGHAIRWISRSGDRDALGLLLPSTAEPDGLTAEKTKGNVRMLAPGSTVGFPVEFGALDSTEATALRRTIAASTVVGQVPPRP